MPLSKKNVCQSLTYHASLYINMNKHEHRLNISFHQNFGVIYQSLSAKTINKPTNKMSVCHIIVLVDFC